jgi:hypothetical protein
MISSQPGLTDGDHITTAKHAVGQVEQGKVTSASFDLEFRPDRPDVFGAQRWLCASQLSLIPWHSLRRGHWNQVGSLAKADFACGPGANIQ